MLSSGSCLQRVAGLVLVLLSEFLVPSSEFELCSLFCIVYTSIARLMSFELML